MRVILTAEDLAELGKPVDESLRLDEFRAAAIAQILEEIDGQRVRRMEESLN